MKQRGRRGISAVFLTLAACQATQRLGSRDASTDGGDAGIVTPDAGGIDGGLDTTDAGSGLRYQCTGSADAGSVKPSGGTDGGRVPTNHRPNNALCLAIAAPGTCGCSAGSENCSPPEFMCSADSQCAGSDAGADGRCYSTGAVAGCVCTYDSCFADTDCPCGQTCACHDSAYSWGGNTCVPGNCRVDADCGAGGFCSPAPAVPCNSGFCEGNPPPYYCHTPDDQCVDDTDCQTGGCVYSPTAGYWLCHGYTEPV
jgi:hypothetical protein